MEYYLLVNSLIMCPFSSEVENLLKKNNIKHKINKITQEEKHKYKNQNISTFHQIYLKKVNKLDK